MKYDQLISMIIEAGVEAGDKEELFDLHDGLLKYWRKECAIHGAAYEEIWAGIDIIDECCANVLAELNNSKPSNP